MKHLDPPEQNTEGIVRKCAESITDDDLSDRLIQVLDTLMEEEGFYCEQGEAAALYDIEPEESVADVVSCKEMIEKVYKGTFSRKGSKVRHEYDAIKNLPQHGKCPLCGIGNVSQLDHYLPKSVHPTFAITPVNLVPVCSDCNKAKLDDVAEAAGEQFFHPYFDDFDHVVWLQARVIEETPPTIVFETVCPEGLDEVSCERIAYHFFKLGLEGRYSSFACDELVSRVFSFERAAMGGVDGVRAFVAAEAEDRTRRSANTWHAAMYRALSESDWFCEEGYKLID